MGLPTPPAKENFLYVCSLSIETLSSSNYLQPMINNFSSLVSIFCSTKGININTTLDVLCALQSQYKDDHMVGPSLGKEGKAP